MAPFAMVRLNGTGDVTGVLAGASFATPGCSGKSGSTSAARLSLSRLGPMCWLTCTRFMRRCADPGAAQVRPGAEDEEIQLGMFLFFDVTGQNNRVL